MKTPIKMKCRHVHAGNRSLYWDGKRNGRAFAECAGCGTIYTRDQVFSAIAKAKGEK